VCDPEGSLASGDIRHLVKVHKLSGSGEGRLSIEEAIQSDMKKEHAA
jgi:hypothetical protein